MKPGDLVTLTTNPNPSPLLQYETQAGIILEIITTSGPYQLQYARILFSSGIRNVLLEDIVSL